MHRRRIALPGGSGDQKHSTPKVVRRTARTPRSVKQILDGNLRGQRDQHNQRHRKNTPPPTPTHQLSGVVVHNTTPAIQKLQPRDRKEHEQRKR